MEVEIGVKLDENNYQRRGKRMPTAHTHTQQAVHKVISYQTSHIPAGRLGEEKIYLQVKNLNSTPSGGQFKNKLKSLVKVLSSFEKKQKTPNFKIK